MPSEHKPIPGKAQGQRGDVPRLPSDRARGGEPAGSRGRVRWRRVLRWAVLLVVAALVVLLSSPYWLPTDWLRPILERKLAEALAVEARVGEIKFRLGRGVRVQCGQVRLTSAVEDARLVLSVEEVESELLLGPLLHGRLEVPEVEADQVTCTLRLGEAGLDHLLSDLWEKRPKRTEEPRGAEGGPREATAERPALQRILVSKLAFVLLDEEGEELDRTAPLAATVTFEGTEGLKIAYQLYGEEPEGATFVLRGSFSEDPQEGERPQAQVELRDLDLEELSPYLKLSLKEEAPRLCGHLAEGNLTGVLLEDGFRLEGSGTVENLEALSASDAVGFSTTRLRVDAALRVTLTDQGPELTVEKLPVESGVFNLTLPSGLLTDPTNPMHRMDGKLHVSGRKLAASVTGRGRVGSLGASGSFSTSGPVRLEEVRVKVADEKLPLLSAQRAALDLSRGRFDWQPGSPASVGFSAELAFNDGEAPGLLARLPVELTAEPLEGRLTATEAEGALQGHLELSSRGLALSSEGVAAVLDRWRLATDYALTPGGPGLELAEATWACPAVTLTRSTQTGPLVASLADVTVKGDLSAEADGQAWSISASGAVGVGPTTVGQEDRQLGAADAFTLQVQGALGLGEGAVSLGDLQLEWTTSGAASDELVELLLPRYAQEASLELVADTRGTLGYLDGRWQTQVSGVGRRALMVLAGGEQPLAIDLEGTTVVLSASVAGDASDVSVRGCQVTSPLGEASLRGVFREVDGRPHVQITGRLASTWQQLGSHLQALEPRLAEKVRDALSRFQFAGPFSLEDVVLTGTLGRVTLEGRGELDDSSVQFDGELLKDAGVRGRMPFRVAVGETVRLEDLALELEGLPRVRVAGDVDRGFNQATLEITVDELAEVPLTEIHPELAQLILSGGVSVETVLEDLRRDPRARAELYFDGVAVELVGAEPVRIELDGRLSVTPTALATSEGEDLLLTVDGCPLAVAFRLERYRQLLSALRQTGEPTVGSEQGYVPLFRCDLTGASLDLTGIEGLLRPAGESATRPVVELTATPDPAQARPREVRRVEVAGEVLESWLAHWLPLVSRQLVAGGSLDIAEVKTSLATVADLKTSWTLREGVLDLDVCLMKLAGGQLDAQQTQLRLDTWPPTFWVNYQATDLDPTPTTLRLLHARFPSLEYSGKMSDGGSFHGLASLDRAQRRRSLSGFTRTEVSDGLLVGPAPVPDHIRLLFPELNLTEYAFTTMSNLATIEEGTFQNRMTFEGTSDIYLDGTTDAEDRVDYELGLRVLKTVSGPASPLTPDLMRLPLMHFTGRIEGGEFVDFEASYISPPELVAKLVGEGLEKHLKKGVLDLGYLEALQEHLPIPGLDLFIGALDLLLDLTIRNIPGLGKEKPQADHSEQGF